MSQAISHSRQEETPEAKARWFQSLSLSERMALLCDFTDMILEYHPQIGHYKDAQSVTGRIRILSQTRR